MKKIACILSIAFLSFGFTKPIASVKAPNTFTDFVADFYFTNNSFSQSVTCWGDGGPSYQMIQYDLDPSEGITGYWT